MLHFKDFVPKMTSPPGFLKLAEYESFEEAAEAANQWVHENNVRLVNIETVVLPNIWNRWEEGTTDSSLGSSGDSPSHWHQFVRCWYQTD